MTHGFITLKGDYYLIATAPHVAMKIKRLILSCKTVEKVIQLRRTADTTEELLWLNDRFPHEISPGLLRAMQAQVRANEDRRQRAQQIVEGGTTEQLKLWNPEFPLRDYQLQAVALSKIMGGLLIIDDVGLGKTAVGIGIMQSAGGKSLVVCQRHLQRQWAAQIQKFCPSLSTHEIAQNKPYDLPAHDVTICTYSKLNSWVNRYLWDNVIYDEVQELRNDDALKYKAAVVLANNCTMRVGLSATPVQNYAGEIYAVTDILSPGVLGTRSEFTREWGADSSNKYRVNDPKALGEWMRGQNIFLRRTRKDVGKELPAIQRINEFVEHNPAIIERLKGQANELAMRVLNGGFHEKGKAARQLDILLRQTTGIAKALPVADFVANLVESGEQVLLGGWHREVYNIWGREFGRRKIPHRLFTGSEGDAARAANAKAFMNGDAKVLAMSLRSGAGLDGLQLASSIVVLGELDWSPQVIEQFVGRLNRDGQPNPVTVFTLYSDAGADPIMMRVLTAKFESSNALINSKDLDEEIPEESEEETESRVAMMAEHWLSSQNRKTI